MSTIEVLVPNIGDFRDVGVVDVLVKPGEAIKYDQSLITLESDKATMEVPSPAAGTVREIKVNSGDRVSEGAVILLLDAAQSEAPAEAPEAPIEEPHAKGEATQIEAEAPQVKPEAPPRPRAADHAPRGTTEVLVPNIGDFKDVGVVDVLVKPGDTIKYDQSLVTLESDKATMEVPSPAAGTVREIKVKSGDRVSEGAVILLLETTPSEAPAQAPSLGALPPPPMPAPQLPKGAAPPATQAPPSVPPRAPEVGPSGPVHASPSVRKLARELGVDLARVPGSGPQGRILQDDVQRFVKQAMTGATPVPAGAALGLLPWPVVDFAKYGPVEARPLSRIRKISAANLARNWVMIPHVTQHDEADITDLEAFRVRLNEEQGSDGPKVTLLAFLVKACTSALARFPEVNASLDGETLVLKRYFHIGFAADTPHGLVVPVVRDADKKGVLAIARELGELSAKAREGKLSSADMAGGTFSISSLGGIGGTAFTPIINAPEVAILGVSRAITKPVWDGERFTPRLVVPLSLSYDHRVIDGAMAARFTTYLGQVLGDLRRLLL